MSLSVTLVAFYIIKSHSPYVDMTFRYSINQGISISITHHGNIPTITISTLQLCNQPIFVCVRRATYTMQPPGGTFTPVTPGQRRASSKQCPSAFTSHRTSAQGQRHILPCDECSIITLCWGYLLDKINRCPLNFMSPPGNRFFLERESDNILERGNYWLCWIWYIIN